MRPLDRWARTPAWGLAAIGALLAVGAVLTWLIGCASAIFLLIALAESVWWLHTHSHHAAVTALGFYGYAAATFAVIPVLFLLRDKLSDWPERRR